MKNAFKTLIVSIIMVASIATMSFALGAVADGTWLAEGTKWKFIEQTTGQPIVKDWGLIKYGDDYNYYYFDENGYMCVGLKWIDGSLYLFQVDGRVAAQGTIINLANREHKIKNKGMVDDVYADTKFDIDAWNAEYIAANTVTAEEKVALEQAAAEAAAAQAAQAELAASLEKRGPRSSMMPIATDKNSGPGVIK